MFRIHEGRDFLEQTFIAKVGIVVVVLAVFVERWLFTTLVTWPLAQRVLE